MGLQLWTINGHHTPEQNAAALASISGMRHIHKCMGIFVLLLTASNILSGLVQRHLTCAYQHRWTSDPAYGGLDLGCRISNGLAVLVRLTNCFCVLATRLFHAHTAR